MRTHPFPLLHPFRDQIDVWLMTKDDDIHSDDDTARLLGDGRLATLDQVHGDRTVIIREPGTNMLEADGMVTDTPEITLAVRAADCQLFLAFAPDENVIGMVHAGWKGLIAGALPRFINAFTETWGIRPEQLLVVAAPSLCVRCSEFTDPRAELPGIDTRFFDERHADLRAIADQQLWSLGVRASRFERMPDCTKCSHETYWSYRGPDRAAVKTGARNVLACRLRNID